MSYNQDYNIGNQSNDMHDVEMGIEENKKGKTKTPSTGTPSFQHLRYLYLVGLMLVYS
jgi:hypothetical protein